MDVETIARGDLAAGMYAREWNAQDQASGIYYYRLEAEGQNGKDFSTTRKLVLIK
ncbi:MAG TPA: hypothetical protein VKS81_00435 [Bacteroidota bacterium]|nr:hypothetical protein [Bacteroidota bacterium]